VRKSINWAILGLVAALGLSACKLIEEETAEQRVEREAAERAERALFSDALKAEKELDRRLRSYIEVRKGFLVVRDGELERDPGDAWHALPLSAPWHVSCTNGWLDFSIGPKDGEGDSVVPAPELIGTVLPHEHCERLVGALGRALHRIVHPEGGRE
jgi:hypothetical protein